MIVDTPEKLAEALRFIDENEVLAYDTETTGLNPRRDKVIGFGISNESMGYYFPIYIYDSNMGLQEISKSQQRISEVLYKLENKKLLMFNASFDARMTKANFGIDLLPALHTDVLLLKHTCDEDFPFGLKEIATKLWGHDVKKEKEEMQASIKTNGGTATQYFKAETSVLGAYCIQDCLLTYKIYNHYSKDLIKQGLTKFYYEDEVLPLYKEVTIPMEEVGVRLNIPLMQSTLKEVSSDLNLLEQEIQAEIAPQLGLFTTWFLNKDYPLQTYTGKVPVWAKKGLTQIQAWEKDYPGEYMFNLLSKHHLKKLFFDTLHEEPLSRTPTGLPQVDEDFLDSIAVKHAWVPKLITYNKLTKIKSTYIEQYLEVQENGILYPSWMQHRTTSGRLGGNLQQLPRPIKGEGLVAKYTNRIRTFIIPDNECKLISADYQSLEPRIFSHTSTDSALQVIFTEGKDFYTEIAKRTEGLKEVSPEARQKAKSYALGLAYGMSPYKLKFEIGCDEQTAERLVADYFNAFPSLAKWMQQSKEHVKYKGQIATQSGRIRHMKRVADLWRKYGACIDNDLQLWKQYNEYSDLYIQAKADRREYKNLLNNSINHQVQGLAASIVNRAAISIMRKLKQEGLKAQIIAQIHDQLLLNCPIAELDRVCYIVRDTMENIVKLQVPLLAKPIIGNNFQECK